MARPHRLSPADPPHPPGRGAAAFRDPRLCRLGRRQRERFAVRRRRPLHAGRNDAFGRSGGRRDDDRGAAGGRRPPARCRRLGRGDEVGDERARGAPRRLGRPRHAACRRAGWTKGTARLTAQATDSDSGMEPRSGGPPPFTAIRVGGGAPAVALGGSVSTEVVAEGAHPVAYYARDAAGNLDDGAAGNGIANRVPRTAWVRIDRTPPEAGFANSQDPRDPDLVRVRITDPLSGPDPARGWIGIRPAGSNDRFERLPAAAPVGRI